MVLFFSMLSFWAQAQNTDSIVYSIIEVNIQDENSSLHYPVLLAKFQDSMYSFTSEERVHLYYGWIFQENYSPIMQHPLLDSLQSIHEIEAGELIDYQHVLSLCDVILLDEPLNLTILRYKHAALGALDQIEAQHDCWAQYKMLLLAIHESSTVENDKTSYMVVHPEDVYHYIDNQPWKLLGETMIMGHVESLKLEIKGEMEWRYFNIGPALEYLSTM